MNRLPPHTRTNGLGNSDDGRYVLLTGATGLVGQYLLRDLLASGQRVAVLVRSSKRFSARQRVETIMQRWEAMTGHDWSRPEVIEGDVSKPQLGISSDDREWIKENCTSLIHNAAVVSFEAADRTQEPWRTNLHGTAHVIEFMKSCRMTDLHYVSTAYVCGDRSGTVLEGELDCRQGFRNAYEESKFQSESLVRRHSTELQTTVYRPSIIAGDSQSGFTSSYHGLMWYLRLLDMLVPQQPQDETGKHLTPIALPIRGDEPHNIVTVDFVSRAIASLFLNPQARGETYHLATDFPTTFRFVIDCCCEFFNSGGVTYNAAGPVTGSSPFAELFFEQSRVYQDYNACNASFDMSNLRRFCPEVIAEPIGREQILRYLQFGRFDKWGKRRETPPKLIQDVPQRLRRMLEQCVRSNGSMQTYLVEVLGPGGGEWVARQGQNGEFVLGRGRVLGDSRPIRISSSDLENERICPVVLKNAFAVRALENSESFGVS